MDLLMSDVCERMELAISRLSEVFEEQWACENEVFAPFKDYFTKTANFLLQVYDVHNLVNEPGAPSMSMEAWQQLNARLYEDISPEAYADSYANPAYACKKLGREYGQILSALYAELRSTIVYAYENREYDMLSLFELYLEIYGKFVEAEDALPKTKYIRESIYYYMYDYADVIVAERIRETICPEDNLALDIVLRSDLSDLRYLYRYGEYIGDNEIKTAEYFNKLDESLVRAMAKTYVDGFIKGFETMRIDMKPKKSVNIRYSIGQERMVRMAIELFEENGLKPIVFRYAVSRMNRRLTSRVGYIGTPANKQYEYDHRMDEALFYDKAFTERKLEIAADVYEKHKQQAKEYAGPACIEVFGENPFAPETCEDALKLSAKQQELSVSYMTKSAELSNKYIPRDQYSFTIIAYPIPEIGDSFDDIFAEIVKINTLDNDLYREIQQTIILALDEAEYIHVVGANGNKTDIKVMLHKIDRTKETNFENCLADVNIPVGEVFTSPLLTGTNGTLHVSCVYLNDLKYKDLTIEFENGCMKNYTCKNFETEEENKAFIKENLMFNHDTLPIGEFAIGTNTTAYVMAHKYDILYKLPILIVEKMGPHFAVGDTCYSYSEESRLYNPDGREIVAKDNECSLLRKSKDEVEKSKAYYNCHTDITIPYEEIGGIYAVSADGTKKPILLDGRFVLPGTEGLNAPFAE